MGGFDPLSDTVWDPSHPLKRVDEFIKTENCKDKTDSDTEQKQAQTSEIFILHSDSSLIKYYTAFLVSEKVRLFFLRWFDFTESTVKKTIVSDFETWTNEKRR